MTQMANFCMSIGKKIGLGQKRHDPKNFNRLCLKQTKRQLHISISLSVSRDMDIPPYLQMLLENKSIQSKFKLGKVNA